MLNQTFYSMHNVPILDNTITMIFIQKALDLFQ